MDLVLKNLQETQELAKKLAQCCSALAKKYQVHILTRNKKLISKNINLKYFYWDPFSEEIDTNCFQGIDAVVNLAGFSVFNLWTNKNKSKILNSRLYSTYFILKQIKENGVKLKSFINASGIAAYSNSKHRC